MNTLVNPYIAGSPVTGAEMFFGREDVFDFVRRTLTGQHQDQVIVLYGQRRTGKTSVLYQMHRHLDPRYLCIFVDLHGLALESLSGFLWELANHIRRALRRDYMLELPELERTAFYEDPRSQFQDQFLNQVWAAAGDRHLLLMLDEAVRLQEQVQAGRLEREVFEYLRHLMQHYERLNFLFSLGSGLEEMEKEYALLFNVALYKKISFLDPGAAAALIREPVEGIYEFEPKALDYLLELTSRHPYYTQLICHSLFNRWQQAQTSPITKADVDATLDEVVERGLAVLKYVWEESTPAERAVLAGMSAAMGEANHPVSARDITKAWAGLNVSLPAGEMSKAMRSLIARDVISGEERYTFTVDLQHRWLRKYERLDWVKEEIAGTIAEWDKQAAATQTVRPLAEAGQAGGRPLGKWLVRLGLGFVAIVAIIIVTAIVVDLTGLSPTSSSSYDTLIEVIGPTDDLAKVSDLALAGDYVWAAAEGGLVRFGLDGQIHPVPGEELGFPDNCVNDIAVAADGSIWLGCGGVAHILPEGDRLTGLDYYDQDDGLGMGVVRALLVDKDGQSVWAGGPAAEDEGDTPVSLFADGEWLTDELPLDDPALEDIDVSIAAMLRADDGALWLGLQEDGVLRLDQGRWAYFGDDQGLGGGGGDFRIRTLLQSDDGALWAAAGEQGLHRFVAGSDSWERQVVLDDQEFVSDIVQLDDGRLWIALSLPDGEGFIARSNQPPPDLGGWQVIGPGQGLTSDIHGIVQTADGRVWIGAYGGGVSVWDGEQWQHLQR